MKPEFVIVDPLDSGTVAPAPAGSKRSVVRTALLVVGVILGLLLWWWSQGAEERAIRGLPEPERRALFQRTLENVTSVCQATQGPMQDFCRNQARMLLEFPECDEPCQGLAQERIQPVLGAR